MQESDNASRLKVAIGTLLRKLPNRTKYILSEKYGLKNGSLRTLESIGKELGVSRERIRQIESAARDFLCKENLPKVVFVLLNFFYEKLSSRGGLIGVSEFEKMIFGDTVSDQTRCQLRFLLLLTKEVHYWKATGEINDGWYIEGKEGDFLKMKEINLKLTEYFRKTKKIMKLDDIWQVVISGKLGTDVKKFFIDSEQGRDRLGIFLNISKTIEKNILDEWGLREWGVILQKHAKDKAVMAFRKCRRPLHFRELAEYINKELPGKKKALPQTLHNIIIKDKRFYFVRAGVYVLDEKLFNSDDITELCL